MMFSTAFAESDHGLTAIQRLRPALLGVAFLASFAIATTASAWSYTLNAPIVIDGTNNAGTGVIGTINAVGGALTTIPTPSGNAAGVVTSQATQDFVWFEITLAPGSVAVDQIQVSVVPHTFDVGFEYWSPTHGAARVIGASYSSGTGVEPNDNGGPTVRAPVAVDTAFGGFAEFNWDFGDATALNHLQGGDTSADLVWVGEVLSGGPGVIFNNTIDFMISAAGGSTPFTVTGIVPEPSTGLLLSSGLIGMAMKRRREARARREAARS